MSVVLEILSKSELVRNTLRNLVVNLFSVSLVHNFLNCTLASSGSDESFVREEPSKYDEQHQTEIINVNFDEGIILYHTTHPTYKCFPSNINKYSLDMLFDRSESPKTGSDHFGVQTTSITNVWRGSDGRNFGRTTYTTHVEYSRFRSNRNQ